MKREEALSVLREMLSYYNNSESDMYVGFDEEDNEAIEMAIKALEQEPCEPCEGSVYLTRETYGQLYYMAAKWNELEKCEDAISRADALDLFGHGAHSWTEQEIQERLETLPSVIGKDNNVSTMSEWDWLIVQLKHNIEMLEQDIEDEGLFGNNYALGKLAAYKDVLSAITEECE